MGFEVQGYWSIGAPGLGFVTLNPEPLNPVTL